MTSVNVTAVTNTVTVVEGDTTVVTITTAGPQGPQGLPGSSFTGFEYIQQTPATTWTINHNLGFRPSVEVFSVGSQELDADVVNTSVNQTVIAFTAATAGSARLN